jgi:phenylpropionate dioxygenase-like ring-hydroxylating dioxygenase large terminal subunit
MTIALENRTADNLSDLLAGIKAAGEAPLTESTTLPPAVYGSAELYQLEVERVFRPGWMPIGRVDQVPNPGDYMCFDLLGEPLVLTRDREGAIHVLSRVCRHRWMAVAEGTGNAHALQCPYHLWTYALSGELVGAPEMQGVDDFDKANCGLPELRHEAFLGFVFVNLDGQAEPLGPQLEPLARSLEPLRVGEQMTFETIDWGVCDWDWKIMVENYMECYHHMGSHRETVQDDYPGQLTWTEDTNDAYSLMHVPPRENDPSAKSKWGTPLKEGLLVNIFPISIFGPFDPGLTVLRVFPLGPGKMHLFTDHAMPQEDLDSPDGQQMKDVSMDIFRKIHLEDIGICEGVQRAAMAGLAPVGRLSLLEEPLWRLYGYLAARLAV